MNASKSKRGGRAPCGAARPAASVRSLSRAAARWITPKPLTAVRARLERRGERVAAEVERGQLGDVAGRDRRAAAAARRGRRPAAGRRAAARDGPGSGSEPSASQARPSPRTGTQLNVTLGEARAEPLSTAPVPGRASTQRCSGRERVLEQRGDQHRRAVARAPCGSDDRAVDGARAPRRCRCVTVLATARSSCARDVGSPAAPARAASRRRRSAAATSAAVSSRHSAYTSSSGAAGEDRARAPARACRRCRRGSRRTPSSSMSISPSKRTSERLWGRNSTSTPIDRTGR